MQSADSARTASRRLNARHVRRAMLGVMALLLLLDAGTLFRSPPLGVADNGDFWRVMRPAGVRYVEGRAEAMRDFVEPRFETVPARPLQHASSAAFVEWAARLASVHGPGVMDLRQSGAAYLLLLCSAVVLLVRASIMPLITGTIVLWIVSDPTYLLVLNSFYADAAALVGGFGVLAWLLRMGDSPSRSKAERVAQAAGLCFYSGMVAFSKASYATLGLLAALAAVAVVVRRDGSIDRGPRITIAVTSAIAVLAVIHFAWGGGYRFPRINRYNAVFTGVTIVSKDPNTTLAALGLPDDRRTLVGKSSFDPEVTDRDRTLTAGVTPLRIAAYYLEHPSAAFEAMKRAAVALERPRPFSRTNRTRAEADGPRFVRPAPWQFGSARRILVGHAWLVPVWVSLGLGWVAVSTARRNWSSLSIVAAYLLATIASQVVAAVLGDGFFGLTHHLLMARLSLDSLIAIELVALSRWTYRRRTTRAIR